MSFTTIYQGQSRLIKKQDQYLVEYIMNGTKTGFSHILELNNIQKKNKERDLKKGILRIHWIILFIRYLTHWRE